MPKEDKNSWAKTMEAIMLHLKFIMGVQGVSLAYGVRHHVKKTHISTGSNANLQLDEEMTAISPLVNARSNLRMT